MLHRLHVLRWTVITQLKQMPKIRSGRKIVSEGLKHAMSDQPDMPSMPESEMMNTVRDSLKKR